MYIGQLFLGLHILIVTALSLGKTNAVCTSVCVCVSKRESVFVEGGCGRVKSDESLLKLYGEKRSNTKWVNIYH